MIGAVVWIFYGHKITKAVTYKKTKGIVNSFTYRSYNYVRRSGTNYYPEMNYSVNGIDYTCYGSRFERDELYLHDSTTILYNPNNPAEGYVYTFLGYWAPYLTFTLPLIFLISLFFGIDVVPNRIYLKKPAEEISGTN